MFATIKESVPENLELKRKVFEEIDELAGDETILASSASCIMPSKFTYDLKHKSHCIVAHPVSLESRFFLQFAHSLCNVI